MVITKFGLFRSFQLFGAALTVVGLAFRSLDWPDAFVGHIAGPLIVLLFIFVEIVGLQKRVHAELERISSKLTVVYKWVIPLTFGTFLASYFVVVMLRGELLDFYIPAGLILVVFWLILTLVGRILCDVFFGDGHIIVGKGKRRHRIPIDNIMEVTRYFFNFYVLKTTDGGRYFFFPSISEMLLRPFQDSSGIQKIKGTLNLDN